MDAVSSKLIAVGILFVLTLVSGVIVSHSARPLNVGLVTIHKLLSVGTVILIGITINQLYKTIDGKLFGEIILLFISAILFLALIATGALLTREEMQLPVFVLKIHQAAPFLALISSSIMLILLVIRRA